MLATVPVGAVQEVSVLSNAFSAEYGWTAGPAMNIVTKSGTNALRGEALYLGRPGDWQAETFSTKGFCAPSVSSCTTPSTLTAINPADVPDELNQVSGSIGGAAGQGQDVLLRDRRLHAAGSDDVPVEHAAVVRAAARRQPHLCRALPAGARSTRGSITSSRRRRRSWSASTSIDFYDTNPQRRGRRHERADRGAALLAAARGRRRSITPPCSARSLLNEARVRVPERRPGHALGGAERCRPRTRAAASVPFTIGESRAVRSLRPSVAARGHAVVDARHAQRALRRQRRFATRPGGTGSEPGTAMLGHVHVPEHRRRRRSIS